MSFAEFRSVIRDARLLRLADFWQASRASASRASASQASASQTSGRLPRWKDIDPVEIAPCLPIIWAWRWDPGKASFVGILAGEEIIAAAGRSPAKRRLDDFLTGPLALQIHEQYYRVMTEPALVYATRTIRNRRGLTGHGERIVLPLADDGINGDCVMGATVDHLSPPHVGSENTGPAEEQPSFFAPD
jgi:hypothetical protein